MSILFAVATIKGISEAFVIRRSDVTRGTPFRRLTLTELAFHTPRLEEGDFRTPAESFKFTRFAKAAISSEFVQVKWKEVDNSQRLSYLDIISSITPVSNCLDQKQDVIDSDSREEPLAEAHRIQQAYREWCEFYGKIPNKERLGVFASNFLTVEEYHKETGRPLVLNEFADLTEEQYVENNQSSTNDTDDNSVETEGFLDEDRIREAYRQWCEFYGRSYDEKRFQTFSSNFVAVEKYHLQTKQPLVLNEFADMTEQEYRKHLATAAHFTTPESIGPNTNTDLMDQSKENDPITSYLDPGQNQVTNANVDELNPSQPQLVQSKQEIINPIAPSGTADQLKKETDQLRKELSSANKALAETDQLKNDLTSATEALAETDQLKKELSFANEALAETGKLKNEISSTNKALAMLQNTVSSLKSMVESFMAAPLVAPPPAAEPLDSLLVDVLQQQEGSISELEESIEGLHHIQLQSSELIELVSNNQKHMTETMEVVQSDVATLKQDQKQREKNYISLLSRIEEVEAVVEKFDMNDPDLNKSLVLSPAKPTNLRRIELKPKIPLIGYVPSNQIYIP